MRCGLWPASLARTTLGRACHLGGGMYALYLQRPRVGPQRWRRWRQRQRQRRDGVCDADGRNRAVSGWLGWLGSDGSGEGWLVTVFDYLLETGC